MDSVNGAGVGTEAATYTLLIIHNGKIILHSDSTVGTGARTFGTAYTAVCAHLSCKSALIVIRASDCNYRTLIHHTDGTVRTVLRAQTAACT